MADEWWRKYQVDIPEGVVGNHRIVRFEMTEKEAKHANFMASFGSMGSGRGYIRPGWYTSLVRVSGPNGSHSVTVMSDTPDEIRDHLDAIHEAERRGGIVRIHGLGIGMVAAAILELPNIERVDVVDISTDVEELVAPTLRARYGDRFNLLIDNVMEQKPIKSETGYSVIWHDIWDNLCTDNLQEMATLHRRWARRTQWQGSWGREFLRYQRERDRRAGW
jgi:hypothetical protein